MPSLKLTAEAPENGWFKDDSSPFGARPIFKGGLLVSGSVPNRVIYVDGGVFLFFGAIGMKNIFLLDEELLGFAVGS